MRRCFCTFSVVFLCTVLPVLTQQSSGQNSASQDTEATLVAKLATAQDRERIDVLLALTEMLQRQGRQDEALPYGEEAESIARRLQLPEAQALALRWIGDTYNLMEQTQDGLRYLGQSLALYEQLGRTEDVAWIRVNRCSVRSRIGQYTDALEDCLQAHDAFAPEDLSGRSASLNSIGTIYLKLGRQDEALKYLEEALEVSETIGHSSRIGRLLNNIALIRIERGEYDQALDDLRRSLRIKRQLRDQAGVTRRLNNIGKVHAKLGDLKAARAQFLEALSLAREVQFRRGEASALAELAGLARRQNDRETAIDLLKQAVVLREQGDEQAALRDLYRNLADLYHQEGRYREGFEALQAYTTHQSELVDREQARVFEEMQSRFESERKEQRIDLLEREKGLADAELARQRLVLYSLLGGSGLVLVIVLLLATRYRQRIRNTMQAENLERERNVSARLRDLDRLKDEFLANTSHELRTPLYGITGLAESLMDGAAGDLPEAARGNLAMISASGRRLTALVGDLLEVSRLQGQGLELVRRPVGLHALADVVLTLAAPLAEGKELRLENETDSALPAAYADENRVSQILLNLVSNAIKFTEKGRVTVSTRKEGDALVVSVADTGIGIPESHVEHIFESFQQGDASIEREFGGTGLGLAISRQLVELHGGRIWVESVPEQGSVFSFTLPIATPQDEGNAADDARGREPRPVFDTAVFPALSAPVSKAGADGPLILAVDDEPVVRQVLRNHLSMAGYRLLQAASGHAALKMIQEEPVDLVLLDVMMPRMSGYEVCRRLRQKYPAEDLPVIFLSAKDHPSDREMGLSAGANDYLQKPLRKGELLLRVKMHLDLLEANRRSKEEVKVLRGMLPMCASCKKVRDDQGYWSEIETYISLHTEAELSHGMCFDCARDFYPELELTPSEAEDQDKSKP